MVTQIKLAVVVVALWNCFGDVVVSEMAITWLRGKLEKNLSPKSVLCVVSVLFRFSWCASSEVCFQMFSACIVI